MNRIAVWFLLAALGMIPGAVAFGGIFWILGVSFACCAIAFASIEEIPEDHPDSLGSLDLLERNGR